MRYGVIGRQVFSDMTSTKKGWRGTHAGDVGHARAILLASFWHMAALVFSRVHTYLFSMLSEMIPNKTYRIDVTTPWLVDNFVANHC